MNDAGDFGTRHLAIGFNGRPAVAGHGAGDQSILRGKYRDRVAQIVPQVLSDFA